MHFGYKVVDKTFGEPDKPRELVIKFLPGIRYRYIKQEISPSLGPVSVTLGGSYDYLEPTFALMVEYYFNDRWGIGSVSELGGFGIGTASEITYNQTVGVLYQFNERFEGKFGYNFQYIDFSRGSGSDEFGLKGNMQGIYADLTISF